MTNFTGISIQTLENTLSVYYRRLESWKTTPEKRIQYLKRIDQITEELGKRTGVKHGA